LSEQQRNYVETRDLDVHPASSTEEHWAQVDGGRMRYLRCGTGPPLVLVHGLLGYSFSWRFAMPEWSQQATVYAVDMLGAGYSDRPTSADYSLRGNAKRLLKFLDEVGVPASDLLGTSHGGAVAMMAAALAPHRIRRLILVAPVNPWSEHGKGLAPLLSGRVISALLPRLGRHLETARRMVLRRLYGDPSRMHPGTLEGYSAPFSSARAFEQPLAVLRSWNTDLEELESLLPRIADILALLMWGTNDVAVDPASATPLSKCFKNCRLVMLEGVGHIPYEEVPEEFNRIISQFLEGDRRP
jgi:pimeloyl-ACP methyl ester carboxylesterase